METLIINVPEKKTELVKQLLTELGVTFKEEKPTGKIYKENLLKVSVWNEDDVKYIQDGSKSFNNLNLSEW